MQKNIFIFDQNKCVGCHACVVACINENGFQEPALWRNVHKSQDGHFPGLPLFYLSLACNHCDDAPCLKNCPALAYSRDKNTGAVIHHPEKCIGCKYCTWACPYDAPKFNPKQGIIEKCTFCNHRIEHNLKPACANLCPVGALDFSYKEFTRGQSVNSSPVPVDAGSKIEINKLRKTVGPEIDLELFKNQPEKNKEYKKLSKISAKEEWPLVIFTLLSALLVSIYASPITDFNNLLSKILYLGFGVFAALLSMLHLGQKQRAWRSVLNIQNSWLSKEILLFSLFFAGIFTDFFLFDIPNIIVTVIGILLLISIDMLYKLATWEWPVKWHSAQTLFIGLTAYALFSESIYVLVFMLALRLTLYAYKSYKVKSKNSVVIALRLILPAVSVFALVNKENMLVVTVILLFGEIIDRIDFYNELQVPEPGNNTLNNMKNYS